MYGISAHAPVARFFIHQLFDVTSILSTTARRKEPVADKVDNKKRICFVFANVLAIIVMIRFDGRLVFSTVFPSYANDAIVLIAAY